MRLVTLSVLGTLVFAGGANAAILTNGSFETGTDPGGGFITVNSPDTSTISGWTVDSGSVDYVGGYWQAADGSRSIDLSGNGPGSLSQTFGTTAGQTYLVSFAIAGNPDSGTSLKTETVSAGVGSQMYSFDTMGHDKMSMGWMSENFSFVATGPTSTLTFASDVGNAYGPALDNVSVSEVPLPASLPMFGGALLALAGFAFFRKRNAASDRSDRTGLIPA